MLREIVLDTETTGIEAHNGDRIVEIGCVELVNHVPTGRFYHVYVNPQRPVAAGAVAVHGLTDAFLADKPAFSAIAADFLAFIGEARLVIHNAAFDVGFLNAEFARLGLPPVGESRVLDTLGLARRRHPGAPASLDALCSRYGIDNSRRTKHGALLDAEILAEVYIELIGGKQADLGLAMGEARPRALVPAGQANRERRPAPSLLSEAERATHAAFVASLKGEPIWRDYVAPAQAAE